MSEGACQNTDRELWRERFGDFYADSIHVTERGGIGINCGGHVIVKPLREWHRIASAPQASQPPQGAEPAQFAEQDERGVWRTEDGFPSPENAWEAMLVARARSGHALSYSDTSRIILDLRRAAIAAPPQGAETVEYMKGVYEFLESTAPAGLADEAFRLPPAASPALRLLLDAIQGDARRERNATARQDQGAGSKDRGPVTAAPPQGAKPWCSCEPTRCEGIGRCRWHAMNYSPLAAPPLPAPQEPAAEPIGVEAVAEVKLNKHGFPYLDWLIEGGISALPEGVVLVVPHRPITDDEGRGEVYAAPAHDSTRGTP